MFRGGVSRFSFRPRQGMTLVEIALALAIAGFLTTTLMRYQSTLADQQTGRAMAVRESEILKAASAWIDANQAAAYAAAAGGPIAIPAGRIFAGGPQPAAPAGLSTLQGGGFLSANFVDTNAFGQNTYLVLRQGAAVNSLEGVVLSVNGRRAPDTVLGVASRYIGADGGAILANPPVPSGNDIVGYKGGWTAAAGNFTTVDAAGAPVGPTPGHVAAYVAGTQGQVIGNFLWRTNIGVPEANSMHTAINMLHNDLNNVEQISGGNPANAVDTAIHIANTMVPAIGANPGVDPAPSEYVDPATGAKYPYYSRIDGKNRFKYLDPSTVIASDDTTDAGNPAHTAYAGHDYPAGMRLIDALPPTVIVASYYVQDRAVVPMPQCGNPAAPDYTRAKIFAMPISNLDYVAPGASTSNTVSMTPVSVVTDGKLGGAYPFLTLTLDKSTVNSIDSNNPVSSATTVDATGLAGKVYAVADNVNHAWLFRMSRKSGKYSSAGFVPLPEEVYDPAYGSIYQNTALVQTACYYGP